MNTAAPEPVPTAEALFNMGREYAEATAWVGGKKKSDPMRPTAFRITDKGHALLGEIMRRNAAAAIARGEGDWHPDPPHTRPRP